MKTLHELGELEIANRLASTNISLLIGSGASRPRLAVLGNIEGLLGAASGATTEQEQVARAYIKWVFFSSVMEPNVELIDPNVFRADATAAAYMRLLRAIREFIRLRDAQEGRHAKLFTTNYDLYLELALEELGLDYEDGFSGRLSPRFDISNFGSSKSRRSAFFDNDFESVGFDIHKLHGSLNWRSLDAASPDSVVSYDLGLGQVHDVSLSLERDPVPFDGSIKLTTFANLTSTFAGRAYAGPIEAFERAYDELSVVNPTPEKLSSTVLTRTYYDQLRLLANELERPKSTLLALGFSFEDSHIRSLVVRAADTNPTLTVIVFAHDDISAQAIDDLLLDPTPRNSNIIVVPPLLPKSNSRKKVAWTTSAVAEYGLEKFMPRPIGAPR